MTLFQFRIGEPAPFFERLVVDMIRVGEFLVGAIPIIAGGVNPTSFRIFFEIVVCCRLFPAGWAKVEFVSTHGAY